MRSLEAAILAELRQVVGDAKLRQKDIQEWSSGPLGAREGELLAHLPELGVNVAYVPRSKPREVKP